MERKRIPKNKVVFQSLANLRRASSETESHGIGNVVRMFWRITDILWETEEERDCHRTGGTMKTVS